MLRHEAICKQLLNGEDAVAPVAIVGVGRVVDEPLLKPLGAPPPRYSQIAHEERRAHLAEQVGHPTITGQLAHAGIDKRIASLPARPEVEEAARLARVGIAPSMARGVERPIG